MPSVQGKLGADLCPDPLLKKGGDAMAVYQRKT